MVERQPGLVERLGFDSRWWLRNFSEQFWLVANFPIVAHSVTALLIIQHFLDTCPWRKMKNKAFLKIDTIIFVSSAEAGCRFNLHEAVGVVVMQLSPCSDARKLYSLDKSASSRRQLKFTLLFAISQKDASSYFVRYLCPCYINAGPFRRWQSYFAYQSNWIWKQGSSSVNAVISLWNINTGIKGISFIKGLKPWVKCQGSGFWVTNKCRIFFSF